MENESCIVIVGPTAVGKSSFLYNNLSNSSLHVISADSMQVYRKFNVGTATPSPEELENFPHTGINELEPEEDYSVAEFLRRADRTLESLAGGELTAVVLGGTGMYIKAYLYGLDQMPSANPDYRRRLRNIASEKGRDYLHERLEQVDPEAGDKIHPNDRRRVIRALEIFHETGQTKTELISGEQEIRNEIDPLVIGLKRPKEQLKQRVERRVEEMLKWGLVDEVRRIKNKHLPSKTLRQAIGYKEVVELLEGTVDRREMVDKIINNTMEFARKQMNWFQRFPIEDWYHPERDKEELIEKIERKLSD